MEGQLNDPGLRQIQAATGLGAEILDGMRMARYTDQPIPALAHADDAQVTQALRFIRGRFLLRDHSRWCPLCINGRWYLRWKLAWSFACTDHEVILSALCPACHEPQEWIHRGGVPDRRLLCPGRRSGTAAAQSRRPPRCNYPLGDTPSTAVTDLVLLNAQKEIDHGFGHPAAQPQGGPVRRLFLFHLLVDLALRYRSPGMFDAADPALVTVNAPGAHPSPLSGHGRTSHGDLAHPLVAASAIHIGLQFVTARDRGAAAERFADLVHEKMAGQGGPWGFDLEYVPWHQQQLLPPRLLEALMRRELIRDRLRL
ncbi:hypothetical protein DMH18_25555 [Streptomyces sp. WAC 06783]|uniref:TniQ family protein n=1 Tax=Streptomyces sp. WAC 06783 TaxID=2203211 RepID=UPI000F74BCFB|nr:TniQ family protein [Streptomyces sp. WAC 06783]RSO07306.1 hypothetical protein DMH18_25555 [Streptomyces sp. WAC 06783]